MDILLVEDSPGDARLAEEAFREGPVVSCLHLVTDGEQALAFLRREGRFASAPRPDLILLDLNLPRRSGHEVLGDIKQDDQLCTIPVIVLTTSENEDDVRRAYRAFANSYIRKPLDLDQFIEWVHHLQRYWFSVVTLPDNVERTEPVDSRCLN